VRDLWRQKEIGTHPDGYTAEVGRHGVILIRLTGSTNNGTP